MSSQPTKSTRKWMRSNASKHQQLEQAVRARCGRSKAKRRALVQRGASGRG